MRQADINKIRKASQCLRKAEDLLTLVREKLENQPYERFNDDLTTEKFIGLKESDIRFERQVLENAVKHLTELK